jgi:hypothetical protein
MILKLIGKVRLNILEKVIIFNRSLNITKASLCSINFIRYYTIAPLQCPSDVRYVIIMPN